MVAQADTQLELDRTTKALKVNLGESCVWGVPAKQRGQSVGHHDLGILKGFLLRLYRMCGAS